MLNSNSHAENTKRTVVSVPLAQGFFSSLQDRLNAILEDAFLNETFTLFINTFPRIEDKELNRSVNPLRVFIYAGIERQRDLLDPEKDPELDESWSFLNKTNLAQETINIRLVDKASKNELALSDIKPGFLEKYFKANPLSENQKREKPILEKFFDTQTDRYLSIPLIQFGEIDGVVHIVYKEEEHKRFSGKKGRNKLDKKLVGKVIKLVSMQYEELILNWDIVAETMEKNTGFKYIFDKKFFEKVNKNPILKELEFPEYYDRHKAYILTRLRTVIPTALYKAYLKVAVISILVDSYSHNVSVHSMTALNWWFKQRAVKLNGNSTTVKRKSLPKAIEAIHNVVFGEEFDFVGELQEKVSELTTPHIRKEQDGPQSFMDYQEPLDRELQQLFSFLAEKGAFWSGVTRDSNFGGSCDNLFNVLWNEFVSNPLYLGTIAKTEKIQRINIKVIIYEPENRYINRNELWVEKQPINNCEGFLAHIDIDKVRSADLFDQSRQDYFVNVASDQLYYSEFDELKNRSFFVQPGSSYRYLKKELSDCKIFFPGSVVGKHAFFTIIENEIRNVKHYFDESLEIMRKEGLILTLSIQKSFLHPEDEAPKLFKLGIWLDSPTQLKLNHDIDGESDYLIQKRFLSLKGSIMKGGNFSPTLGGIHQDKICAAMLLNNYFTSVQRGSKEEELQLGDIASERDQLFYPWVVSAAASVSKPHQDLELNSQNTLSNNDHIRDIETNVALEKLRGQGFFKKYFYLWEGADVYEIKSLEREHVGNWSWENVSRFRFVRILEKDPKQKQRAKKYIRKERVFRILTEKQSSTPNKLLASYEDWLDAWLNVGSISMKIAKKIPSNDIPELINYLEYNAKQKKIYYDRKRVVPEGKRRVILVSHKPNSNDLDVIHYRNHGIFKQYFLDELLDDDNERKIRMAELLEAMETRICIFDNRARSRVSDERVLFYRTELNLVVHEEEKPVFENEKWHGVWADEIKDFIPDCNILVMHLTYIDNILDAKANTYSEEDQKKIKESKIGFFIEKEIIPNIGTEDADKVRENFLLFITTGRGRIKWWENLVNSNRYSQYEEFTSFRPVESIIEVMENALSRRDEFELKYNLVKILLGS